MVRICKGPSGIRVDDYSDFSDLPSLDTLFSGKGPVKRKRKKRIEKVQQSIETEVSLSKPFIPKRVDL